MLNLFAKHSDADSGERLLNMFLRPSQGESVAKLLGRSGLDPKWDLGGEVRAMLSHRNKLYAVANGNIWLLGDTAVSLGIVQDGVTVMASGDTQIGITAAGRYYCLDTDTEDLTEPTTEIGSAVWVGSLDRYFILAGSYGERGDAFQVSALGDGTTWNALDFAFTEANSDDIVGGIINHTELWLLGRKSVEKYYNSGADFPFSRISGAILEKGCLNAGTISKADSRVFWVGADRVVYVGSGAESAVVSARWVEDLLVNATITGGMVFQDRGTLFYAITREGATTLVYDITSGLWCERSTGLDYGPWIATCAALHGGVHYIGASTGAVCTQSETTHTDVGRAILAEAISAPITSGDLQVVSILRVMWDGNRQDIDRTPQAMLQVSKNGRTWGREKWRDMPGHGEYAGLTTWRALGQSRHWQFRVRVTDPVNRDMLGVQYA